MSSAARRLAQGIIRSSSLSVRGLSTTRSLLTFNTLKAPAKNNLGVSQVWSHQPMRQMSATAKFEVINVQDEADFNKRVIEASSTMPVVVDFHAEWCGPCKILGPRLESLLSKGEGKVLMAKVDIDDHPDLAMEYGVRSVPTVVGMKNGKVQNQFIGVIDDDQIGSFVDKLVVS